MSKTSGPEALPWGFPGAPEPWADVCHLLSTCHGSWDTGMTLSAPRLSGTQVTPPAS